MKKQNLRSIVGVFALALMVCCMGSTVHAAEDTKWSQANAGFYNAAKVYSNNWYDGYSFYIDILAKKGKKEDQKSYDKLHTRLDIINPQMYGVYGNDEYRYNVPIKASKDKKYTILLVDKNGTPGKYKTSLNAMIKGYGGKTMNAKITHTID